MSVCRQSLLVTFSLMALCGASSSLAQQPLEEIIVTASKRAQTLQETPIAVSVVDQEDIERTAIIDLIDLQYLVPSLRIETGGRSTSTNFVIRGFGASSASAALTGTEPSVGVFIDGVFRSRSTSTVLDLPRVERVEVLRGPQNTLFGKNASSGVISIVTPEPSREFSTSVEATIGRFDQRVLKGYVSGAISDTLAMSLSGTMNRRDGYVDTPLGVDDLNQRDRIGFQFQALYEPTDSMKFRVIADHTKMDENCCGLGIVQTGGTEALIVALGGQVQGTTDDQFAREAFINFNLENKIEDQGISLHADIDFEGFLLSSITAYRDNDRGPIFSDIDNTSLDMASASTRWKIKTFSQEVRLTSTTDGPLDWMLGGFLFSEEILDDSCQFFGEDLRNYAFALVGGNLDGTGGPLGALESLLGLEGEFYRSDVLACAPTKQDNLSYSVFGNVDFAVTDSITLSGGLNYTKDDKEVRHNPGPNTDVFGALDLTTIAGGAFAGLRGLQLRPPLLAFPNVVEDGETSDSETTWLARVAWDINDNINVYASAATGFKPTSWVLGISAPFLADQAAIEAAGIGTSNQLYGARYSKPERSEVFEVGLKASFARAHLYVTYFDQNIKDFQTRGFDGVNFIATNAGKVSVDGFEVEAMFLPTDNWLFSFSGTWLDPIFDDYQNAPGPVGGPRVIDRSGTKPGGVHEFSGVADVTYSFELGGLSGFVRADYLYEKGTGLSDAFPEIEREIGTLNASVGVDFNNGFSAQLWARNLNNDEYLIGAGNGVAQPGTIVSVLSEPRTYGLTVRYRVN